MLWSVIALKTQDCRLFIYFCFVSSYNLIASVKCHCVCAYKYLFNHWAFFDISLRFAWIRITRKFRTQRRLVNYLLNFCSPLVYAPNLYLPSIGMLHINIWKQTRIDEWEGCEKHILENIFNVGVISVSSC